jgi:hypothetical protein
MAEDESNQDRTDEELNASDEDAHSAAARAMLKRICVSGPGIVMSFDPVTQTASVQPAIKKKFRGSEVRDAQPCVNVPVQFPAGGPLILTFPIKEGDEGILVFGDRAIDHWLAKGGTQEPSEIRFHDPSDAMFIPGISSEPRAIGTFSMTSAELRTREGAIIFRATPPEGGGTGQGSAQAAVLSEAILECIAEMSFATGMGPTGVGPLNMAAFKAKIKSMTAFVGP